jgi:DNA polymerase-3 subunit delta
MITTLTGNNDYLLKQALLERKNTFIQQHTDMGFEQYEGEDIKSEQVPSIMQSVPFLADKRMVVLRKPSAQKAVAEQIEKLLNEVPETTDLIILEPAIDKRTSYYKALQKQTEFLVFDEVRDQELVSWLVNYAKQQGGELGRSEAQFLVARIGPNQMMLAQEINKLIQYKTPITKDTIIEMTDPLPQSSVFDLLDAALAGDTKRVITLYKEQRQQKVEPLAIMAMLSWQLHILAVLKTADGRSPQTIASEARISPYVIRKSQNVANRVSLVTLKQWITDAFALDVRLKSEPIDADDAILYYLLSLKLA